jgi:hypothetical protein
MGTFVSPVVGQPVGKASTGMGSTGKTSMGITSTGITSFRVATRRVAARRLVWLLGAAGLLCAMGCGESGPRLYPVSGTVRFDGKPLPQVGVSFFADASKGNDSGHIAAAAADVDGRFTLSTVGEFGAPPGWYKVVVSPYTPGPVEVPKPPYNVKYLTLDTTDLSIEVKADAAPNAYDLSLDK